MKKILILCLVVGSLTGCAAYKSLIGHPVQVLIDQHKYNEQQEQARKLGEAMYNDTHPK